MLPILPPYKALLMTFLPFPFLDKCIIIYLNWERGGAILQTFVGIIPVIKHSSLDGLLFCSLSCCYVLPKLSLWCKSFLLTVGEISCRGFLYKCFMGTAVGKHNLQFPFFLSTDSSMRWLSPHISWILYWQPGLYSYSWKTKTKNKHPAGVCFGFFSAYLTGRCIERRGYQGRTYKYYLVLLLRW